MTKIIKPALVYVRGNSNNSKENQKRFIQQQVTGSNFNIADTMSDTSSATTGVSRPGLQQLFDFLQSPPAIHDGIVDGPSRLSHRKTEVKQIVQRLDDMNVKVHYAEDGLGSVETVAVVARFFRRAERRLHGQRIQTSKRIRCTR